jgi:hypothetical protein
MRGLWSSLAKIKHWLLLKRDPTDRFSRIACIRSSNKYMPDWIMALKWEKAGCLPMDRSPLETGATAATTNLCQYDGNCEILTVVDWSMSILYRSRHILESWTRTRSMEIALDGCGRWLGSMLYTWHSMSCVLLLLRKKGNMLVLSIYTQANLIDVVVDVSLGIFGESAERDWKIVTHVRMHSEHRKSLFFFSSGDSRQLFFDIGCT